LGLQVELIIKSIHLRHELMGVHIMNDFLKLNSNTLAGLNQKAECDTIIELSKNDLSSVTAGMKWSSKIGHSFVA
jgi:hypothetical protein